MVDRFLSFLVLHLESVGAGLLGLIAFISILLYKRKEFCAKKALKKAVESKAHEVLTLHPVINQGLCMGCGTCTRACPEGKVLQIINHKSVLVSPTKCVGHGECEKACPRGAISLVFGTKTRGFEIPKISAAFESNIGGLYIAGELGGMGLIRNAVKQGVIAATHALSNHTKLPKEANTELLIVGAGPAGLAASLTAIEKRGNYILIEQNKFGGTIANYPKQKIVMTSPLDLPIFGRLKFKDRKVSKEELMDAWHEMKKKAGMKVQSGVRFDSLEKINGLFRVKTNQGIIIASKIILAIGLRGTPNKLGLPNEDLPKVTYNLADPEQYRNNKIAIVGSGNSAVEAALMLALPDFGNEVVLLIRGKEMDKCNEENKNKALDLRNKRQLKIWFESTVGEIQAKELIINKGKEKITIPNDFLFIFAGAQMPQKFLGTLGVEFGKKFEEGLTMSRANPLKKAA
jgi:thioredoxin reductase (NADPH)